MQAESSNLFNLSSLLDESMRERGAVPRTSREPAVNDDLGFMRRLTGRCPRCDCRYPLHIHAGPTPEPKTLIFVGQVSHLQETLSRWLFHPRFPAGYDSLRYG